MTIRPLIIYHGKDCADGFAAAWVAWRYFAADADFHAASYGEPPPDAADREVYVLDFSYPRAVTMSMALQAKRLTILDHHLSAQKELENQLRSAEVKLSSGEIAYVDAADFDTANQFSWSNTERNGVVAYAGGGQADPKMIRMGELIIGAKDDLVVDHRNRNTLDNRRSNLRHATKQQNGANMDRGNRFKGVTPHHDRFRAQITVSGQHRHIGVYDTEEEAARAYDAAAVAAWGEFARTNFGMVEPFPPNVEIVFDMMRSGAGLAWDWFFPGLSRPALVRHVEDRDLWRFDYPETRTLHAALASYPMDFATWDRLALQMARPEGLIELHAEGVTLDRMHLKRCHEIIEQASRTVQLAGYTVPICAAPYAFASDIGNILSKGQPFAATYVEHGGGTTFSLRSQKDGGEDVSAIAEVWGGGGHRNAAGFTISGAQGVAGVATVPQDEEIPTRPA